MENIKWLSNTTLTTLRLGHYHLRTSCGPGSDGLSPCPQGVQQRDRHGNRLFYTVQSDAQVAAEEKNTVQTVHVQSFCFHRHAHGSHYPCWCWGSTFPISTHVHAPGPSLLLPWMLSSHLLACPTHRYDTELLLSIFLSSMLYYPGKFPWAPQDFSHMTPLRALWLSRESSFIHTQCCSHHRELYLAFPLAESWAEIRTYF